MNEDLNAFLNTLPGREQQVLRLRYGLDGAPPRTLEQAARVMGVTRERARHLQTLATALVPDHLRRELEKAAAKPCLPLPGPDEVVTVVACEYETDAASAVRSMLDAGATPDAVFGEGRWLRVHGEIPGRSLMALINHLIDEELAHDFVARLADGRTITLTTGHEVISS